MKLVLAALVGAAIGFIAAALLAGALRVAPYTWRRPKPEPIDEPGGGWQW